MADITPHYIIIGKLTRDFVLLPSGRALLDVPGGNTLFSSVGLLVWEPDSAPGIVARVGEDYPQKWLIDFTRWGLDTRGIRILPEAVDLRSFVIYADLHTRFHDDPVAHFAATGTALPESLIRLSATCFICRQPDTPAINLSAPGGYPI